MITFKCSGWMGIVFGHNYIPIITKGASKYRVGEYNGGVAGLIELHEKGRDETYNGIICSRCGDKK